MQQCGQFSKNYVDFENESASGQQEGFFNDKSIDKGFTSSLNCDSKNKKRITDKFVDQDDINLLEAKDI